MLNSTNIGTGLSGNQKKIEIQNGECNQNNNLFGTRFKLDYVIPLYESTSQDIDIGIVHSKEFGYNGIVVKDGNIHILPVERIVSGLDDRDSGINLVHKLFGVPSDSWRLVYDEKRQRISVWPKLRAAGKLGEFNTLGPTKSSSSTLSHVESAFNNLVKNGGSQAFNSFSGAITVYKLDKPLTVYRIEGATGNKIDLDKTGRYWSTTPPNKPTQYALENAMHPKFYATYGKDGNQGKYNASLPGSHVVTATIPAGTVIYIGKVSEQHGFSGGAQQILLDNAALNSLQNKQAQTLSDFINKNPNNPNGGTNGPFGNNVNQNGLNESFKSTNPNNPTANAPGAEEGEIGGVAICDPNAIILNMNNSLYDLTADGYWLAFPSNSTASPFSNKELQQIIRELAQTVYIHNTFPFYSLHFTKEGTLYSVIHPAYQNTLVGKVIGNLRQV